MQSDRLDRSWLIESAAIMAVVVLAFSGCCLMLFATMNKEPERLANPYEGLRKIEWEEHEMTDPNPLFPGEIRK